MEIQTLYPGSWGSNCYLLISGRHAAVVDPSPDTDTILATLEKKGAVVDFILLTHGHFDHIVSLDSLREMTLAPAYIHADDAEMLEDAEKNAFYTFFRMNRTYREADRLLHDGDEIKLGDETVRVLHTPGHTKGSVCYQIDEKRLLTGDTLFSQGYGRYDLYGGNADTLFSSLSKLRALPSLTMIYPGHGDTAFLGDALDTVIY